MGKIVLYSHGGSGNHGCEAIVRGTYKLLDGKVDELYSYRKEEDIKYGLNELMIVKEHLKSYARLSFKRIKASILIRLFHNDKYAEKISYDALFKNVAKGDIALSIGGDNYCYDSFREHTLCNKVLTKKGVKTVLWGCSVEPSKINETMKEDLANYNAIVARESLTYDAVKFINKNTYLYPDPAFQLDCEEVELPKNFIENNTVGINISPMIISNESQQGVTKTNYINLIRYILENTDMNVALIPHVVWENNDDRTPIEELYEIFKDTGRIIKFGDFNCKQLKYIISKCRFFIGARTHSTIAAYSTCVPTLVVGYSVKAKGIAKDLFGSYENYVISVQSLTIEDDLINAFLWLSNNELSIKEHLEDFIPKYKDVHIDINQIIGVKK